MRVPGEEKSIIRWGEALGGEGLPHCLGNAGLTGLCRVRGPWGEGACHSKAAARRKVGESGAEWWVGVVFPWLLLSLLLLLALLCLGLYFLLHYAIMTNRPDASR